VGQSPFKPFSSNNSLALTNPFTNVWMAWLWKIHTRQVNTDKKLSKMEHRLRRISQSIARPKKLIIRITVSRYPVHLTYLSLSSPLFAKRDYLESCLQVACKSKILLIPLRLLVKVSSSVEGQLWLLILQIKHRMQVKWWPVTNQVTFKTYSISGRICTWRFLKTREFSFRLTIKPSIQHFSKIQKHLPGRSFLTPLSARIQGSHCLSLSEKTSIRRVSGTGQKRS
jgi:hypothetical protein